MSSWKIIITSLVFFVAGRGYALEPDQILVIANKDVAASERIARYYCKKRGVPLKNILSLSLGVSLKDTITRDSYEKWLAGPIREELLINRPPGEIRCLLTTYGVPYKVGKRGPIITKQATERELLVILRQEKDRLRALEQGTAGNTAEKDQTKRRIAQLQMDIDRISGKETDASVDSELSMVLFGMYDLYRWQANMLRNDTLSMGFKTLMVSRLDGPEYGIIKGLIDKAIATEKKGLKGIAYIDSRGLTGPKGDFPSYFDQTLLDLAMFIRVRTDMPVREERRSQLFQPGACPQTAIYCGWYSVKKYVDAFDFVDGAVGYHISSFEAADLRDPNSSQWCNAMLRDGITATLGAVAEPYLHSFPEPKAFFPELFKGSTLVEAYYRTKPFNSWRLMLIGDPLYRPFKKSPKED